MESGFFVSDHIGHMCTTCSAFFLYHINSTIFLLHGIRPPNYKWKLYVAVWYVNISNNNLLDHVPIEFNCCHSIQQSTSQLDLAGMYSIYNNPWLYIGLWVRVISVALSSSVFFSVVCDEFHCGQSPIHSD